MSLKVYGNSAIEAAITAQELNQGDIGKVVTVDNTPNTFPAAVNCFLVRASKYDAEGGMVFVNGVPKMIKAEHLYHYRVVKMTSGFKLIIEVA